MYDVINKITNIINNKINSKKLFIFNIDGMSCSGKSTIAEHLQKIFDLNIIHMDDFYLPFDKRTNNIMQKPEGHIDFEKIKNEILIPLKNFYNKQNLKQNVFSLEKNNKLQNKFIFYRPFDCHNNILLDKKLIDTSKSTLIEGSYSSHPSIKNFFDFSLFFVISNNEQTTRIKKRNAEKYQWFIDTWVTRENEYFKNYKILETSDFILNTN